MVNANADDSATNDLVKQNDLVRRVHLGMIQHQHWVVTDLRHQNLINDIVLRELQAELDLAEAQLFDAADTD